MTVIFDVVQTV